MEFEETLERLITLMIDKKTLASVSVGKASNINKNNDTCDVEIDDGLMLHEVRLRAIIDEGASKVVTYPSENTQVLVLMLGKKKEEAFLLACSNVEERVISIGSQNLVVNAQGFCFNGGEDGMVKLPNLIDWMGKVSTDLTTLKTLLSTSTVAGNGLPLGIIFAPTAKTPVRDDLEDKKILH